MQALCDAGARLDFADVEGEAALMRAARAGHAGCAARLLAAHADTAARVRAALMPPSVLQAGAKRARH